MLLTHMAATQPSGSDPDAAAWAAAVTANSGTYSEGTLAAVTAFIVAAKAGGYWAKLTRINAFAGNQYAAAAVPIKAAGGAALDTFNNFGAGDFAENRGLRPDGTMYVSTGLVASSLTRFSSHAMLCTATPAGSRGSAGLIGAFDAGDSKFYHFMPVDGNADRFQTQHYAGAGFAVEPVAGSPPGGMALTSRTANNVEKVFRNGVLVGTNTAVEEGALPDYECYVCAYNQNTFASGSWSHADVLGYSFGSGLSEADAAAFYTDWSALMTDLGRT